MQHYYNTTNSSGIELLKFIKHAESQEGLILNWFEDHPGFELTPSQVTKIVLPSAIITSVRRALTNLTTAGLLTKTDKQLPGPFGRPEYAWKLKRTEDDVQRDLFGGGE